MSNPRKSLRLRLACPATVVGAGLRWSGATEDVGPHGCRLTAPSRLEPGVVLRALLICPESRAPVVLNGTVSWCSAEPPWEVGLRFDGQDRLVASAWFDDVASRHLHLLHEAHDPIPDRLPLAARLLAGEVEGEGEAAAEATLLRLARWGVTVSEAVRLLDGDAARAQRALFKLLARGRLTLDEREPPAGGPVGPGRTTEERGDT